MRCAECGAEAARATQVCSSCGAPVARQRPTAANPAAIEEGFVVASVYNLATDGPGSRPGWARRGRPYFLICFGLCLVLFSVGAAATDKAPPYTWLSPDLGYAIPFSVVGGIASLALFAVSLWPVSDRQFGWAVFPLVASPCRSCRFGGSRSSAAGPGTGPCLPPTWPPPPRGLPLLWSALMGPPPGALAVRCSSLSRESPPCTR
jgi:hypothetical protein